MLALPAEKLIILTEAGTSEDKLSDFLGFVPSLCVDAQSDCRLLEQSK